MSATLMSRAESTDRSRHSNGRFATEQRGEAGLAQDSLVQCRLCPTCQQARNGVDTGEECAVVVGGSCVLSPQDCACGACSR